ncbi:MAG TPA: RNase adapter RapZ [Marmoricola sp.]|nr:RNase adapter RapZ [Marmoricola sp.]
MSGQLGPGVDDHGEPWASGKPGEPGELVVVTGMTGAGRSTAAKELEDLGYFVVDNLPPELVTEVVRLVDEQKGRDQPIAVVVDVRGGTSFHSLREQLAQHLPTRRTSMLFLEADDDILVRRQEAARRPHPLQAGGRLIEGIHRERTVMSQLRGDADVVIDTTPLNVHQLQDKVAQAFGDPGTTALKVTVVSFGFKYGVPVDADLLADMRFLPNPFWVPELRDCTGRDSAVASYVLDRPDTQTFLERYIPVIETVGDGYLREGKRFMTIAIGCTGGKHRSVAMAEEIAARLRALGLEAQASHRDLGRE